MTTFVETLHPRESTGRFTERVLSEPETVLAAPAVTLADAVERNADVFHPASAAAPQMARYSKSVTVGGTRSVPARMALVWHEDEGRFIVDAWYDMPMRSNRFVHVSDLLFDDERIKTLACAIEREQGATAAVVDELAEFIRSCA